MKKREGPQFITEPQHIEGYEGGNSCEPSIMISFGVAQDRLCTMSRLGVGYNRTS
jgi:hypothetical protein